MCTEQPGTATTLRSVDIRLAIHRNASTVRTCICCPWTVPTRVHAPHAVIVTRSHMCRSEAGAAVPPRFITASHVCTLPWLPSLSISFPLPICSLFHLISLSFIFAYPFSSVSHPRLFRSSSLIYKHQCVCIYPSGIAIVE